MKITKIQREILEHRLSSGCVEDVLADSEHLNISAETASVAVASVERMVALGEIPLESISREEREVLIDCLDGSTYFADMDDAVASGLVSRSRARAASAAAEELERALSAAFGVRVRCIMC